MDNYDASYMIYYEGKAGFGNAAAVIQDGIIRGKDCAGGDIKGIARIENGQLIINVTIFFTGAPGTFSVINGSSGPGLEQTIEFALPKDFKKEAIVNLTNLGFKLRVIRL